MEPPLDPQIAPQIAHHLFPQKLDVRDAVRAESIHFLELPVPLFPHALSKGYSDPTGCVVKSVNGTAVRSLAHLVALLRDLKDDYLTLDFDNRASEAMVFPRAQLVASTEAILTDNGVRAQGSPDMMKIWEQK